MKSFLRISCLAAVATLVTGCKDPQNGQDAEAEVRQFPEQGRTVLREKIVVPVDKVLTDTEGRELDAIVLGKNHTHLFVTRKVDNLNFEVAIETLSPADQKFAEAIPFQRPPSDFADNKVYPPYIKSRLEAIADLEEKNEVLRGEISGTTNSMIVRTKETQIKKNEKEIERFRADIEKYRLNNPG